MRSVRLLLVLAAALVVLPSCSGRAPLPPRAVELNDAGARALAAGDLDAADARLSVALEYAPDFVDALVNLGLVELARGNFERARRLLLRARRLNPDVAQPHHALGVLAERERRPDRASEHYREALAVDPGFVPARANLGRLQFDAGQLDDAWLTFKKLTEAAPNSPEGPIGLVETLIRLGRATEAAPILRAATARFPNEARLTVLDARFHLRAGRTERARELLLPLATRHDEVGVTALAWLGVVELVLGRPREAAGAARRSLDLDPDEPLAAHVLAQALAALGDPAATAWAERAKLSR
ncbi:MAG: tetratricopeptide repeat protein [Pseudomonadota bacterium]|nr:MAG: hypothetical protein DIU78_22300 [Pseudomonadota bacterium]